MPSRKSSANEHNFLNINNGFEKTKYSPKLYSKTYKTGFLSFKTDEFLCWLCENKRLFSIQTVLTEWRLWIKYKIASFMFNLDDAECFFRLNFSITNCEGFFLINQSVSVLNSHNGQFASTLIDKICIRIDEERFAELQGFIESFDLDQMR